MTAGEDGLPQGSSLVEKKKSPGRKPRMKAADLINAAKEAQGIPIELPKPPPITSSQNIKGFNGHWEFWLGRRWWVKVGETIEDSVKRSTKSLSEINRMMKGINEEHLERTLKLAEKGDYNETMTPLQYAAALEGGTILNKPVKNPDELLRQFVSNRAKDILEKMWELAMGTSVLTKTKAGTKKYYDRPPDKDSLFWFADQFYGKAKTKLRTLSELEDEKPAGYEISEAK